MNYELIDLEENVFETYEFEHEIKIGEFEFYYVFCDNNPYLKVEADTKKLFDDAIIYNSHLLIGSFDKVYFINLLDFGITELEVEMYFGYFEVHEEAVYILDGRGIIAFDKNLEEIWRNHNLAVDGVISLGMIDEEIMSISCEMDPPGCWVDKKINIISGEIVELTKCLNASVE